MELKDNKRVLQKMRAFDKYISKMEMSVLHQEESYSITVMLVILNASSVSHSLRADRYVGHLP